MRHISHMLTLSGGGGGCVIGKLGVKTGWMDGRGRGERKGRIAGGMKVSCLEGKGKVERRRKKKKKKERTKMSQLFVATNGV